MLEGESVSLQVVKEVADREGIDPTDLQPPLHTAINTEALDELFRSTPSRTRVEGAIEFQYQGYQIRVSSSGEVQVGEMITFKETDTDTQLAEDTVEN